MGNAQVLELGGIIFGLESTGMYQRCVIQQFNLSKELPCKIGKHVSYKL